MKAVKLRGFPPIAASSAHILILGSMPGAASLAAQRYYAHPRNAFWPIMGELLQFDADEAYATRAAVLKRAGIALWDVLNACVRPGSLDAAIVAGSHEANDFARFFAAHPGITHVFFNGATAEGCFRRLVMPALAGASGRAKCPAGSDEQGYVLRRLPSTSPAHAGQNFARKLAAWRAALAPLLACTPTHSRKH